MEESVKYKKMYLKLFNAVTDALEEKDREKSDEILKKAQCDCEEIYIEEEQRKVRATKNGAHFC